MYGSARLPGNPTSLTTPTTCIHWFVSVVGPGNFKRLPMALSRAPILPLPDELQQVVEENK